MSDFKLKNDGLDRGRYARTLYNIIGDYELVDAEATPPVFTKRLNCTDNKSFVLAISAKWGFGKTTFVNSLYDVLCGEGLEVPDGQDKDNYFSFHFDTTKKLNTKQLVMYDAWANDHYDNALEPLFHAMIKGVLSTQFNNMLTDEQLDAFIEAYFSFGKKEAIEGLDAVAKTALEATLSPVLGILSAGVDVFKAFGSSVKKIKDAGDSDKAEEKLFTYVSKQKQIKKFQDLIQKSLKGKKKLVIFIDELDRCKPTFAVRTLEIVKHLFNIPGLVFIFSLDIDQLQYCVRTVYGNDFDAIGYLERFFDYTTLLPEGKQEDLFKIIAKEFNITGSNEQIDCYYKICTSFHLSVREMRAVCASFFYLSNYELRDYPDHAKQLYFYLLVLKYKQPVGVIDAISDSEKGKTARTELIEMFPPVFSPDVNGTDKFIEVFKINSVIGESSNFNLIETSGKTTNANHFAFPPQLNNNQKPIYDLGGSLSYVLYKQDEGNNEMLKMRLLQYLFQKVEMYNTPKRLDETNHLDPSSHQLNHM